MTSRILVPLDGSTYAERALPCATMLAKGLRAELVLFRAVALPLDAQEVLDDADLETDAPLEQLITGAQAYLDRVASRLEGADLHVHQVIRQGPAAAEIVDYAEEMDIQQIVMATHGYGGISRWRHGSVAERVLQSASKPVLMICALGDEESVSQKPQVCRRILVPLDGSPIAEQVLPTATSVAQAFNAEIILFRVAVAYVSGPFAGDWYLPLEGTFETAHQIAEVYLSHVADDLKEQGLQVSTAVRSGGVADSIVDYAAANHIDLIAMCTHGRTGMARWTLGSVADRVLRAHCKPLLLVRAQ